MRQTTQHRVPVRGNKASKPLTEKTDGSCVAVLELTQTHPPGNQHQKGPIYLWVAEKVTESWPRAEQAALFPL